MNANKMLAVTLLLLGILFVLMGGGIIYVMMMVSSALSNPLLAGAAPGAMSYVALGWVVGVLQFITGILAIVSAALFFGKDKKK